MSFMVQRVISMDVKWQLYTFSGW